MPSRLTPKATLSSYQKIDLRAHRLQGNSGPGHRRGSMPNYSLHSSACPPLHLGTKMFHAATWHRLDLMPDQWRQVYFWKNSPGHQSVFVSGLSSPTNYTFYPWTLHFSWSVPTPPARPMACSAHARHLLPSLPGGVSMKRTRSAGTCRDTGVLLKTIGEPPVEYGSRCTVKDIPTLRLRGRKGRRLSADCERSTMCPPRQR